MPSYPWPRRSPNNLIVKQEESIYIEKQENRFPMLYILPPAVRDRIPSRSTLMGRSFSSAASPSLSETEIEVGDEVPLADSVQYSTERKFLSTLSTRSVSTVSARSGSASPNNFPSGVSWRHASQGLDLIRNSYQESKRSASPDYDDGFERSSYVNGVRYLLDGLPDDMDESEVIALQSSMPGPLVESLEFPAGRHSRCRRNQEREPLPSPNLVHRITLLVLRCLQRWLDWAVPTACLIVAEMLRLEKEHHILKVLLEFATVLLQACCAIWASFAGQTTSRVLQYGVEGVEGAFREFRRPEPSQQRRRR